MKNSMKNKFSVIIPVYNAEQYLRQCIDSVLAQTYQLFEIILMDDGSADSSYEICKKYAGEDERIKAFTQSNTGQLGARSNALKHAAGDYCLFLDSDDFWDDDLLETINGAIEKHNSDLIIFKLKTFENGKAKNTETMFANETVFEGEGKKRLFETILSRSIFNSLAIKAVKRSLIEDVDYEKYKSMRRSEDLLVSLPWLYNAEKILYLGRAMYNYRTNPNSITYTGLETRIDDLTTARGKTLEYMKKIDPEESRYLSAFYNFYLREIIYTIESMVRSGTEKEKLQEIFEHLDEIEMFNEALKYKADFNYSIYRKLLLTLLVNKKYDLMVPAIKIRNLGRK